MKRRNHSHGNGLKSSKAALYKDRTEVKKGYAANKDYSPKPGRFIRRRSG